MNVAITLGFVWFVMLLVSNLVNSWLTIEKIAAAKHEILAALKKD